MCIMYVDISLCCVVFCGLYKNHDAKYPFAPMYQCFYVQLRVCEELWLVLMTYNSHIHTSSCNKKMHKKRYCLHQNWLRLTITKTPKIIYIPASCLADNFTYLSLVYNLMYTFLLLSRYQFCSGGRILPRKHVFFDWIFCCNFRVSVNVFFIINCITTIITCK